MCKGAAAVAACALAAAGCTRAADPALEQAQAPPAVTRASTSPRSCTRLDLTPLTVARVDEPQRRLFAVAPVDSDRPMAARIRDLESCFELTGWAGRWHLSVFTDDTMAGYKDEPRLAAAVADGRWARAYLAEYDAASKRVTRNPAGAYK